MDGFSRHYPQQHGSGAFWYPSSSSPPPLTGYHTTPPLLPSLHTYHHQPNFASQSLLNLPPQHQLPQQWFHPSQQPTPPIAMASSHIPGPPPNYPTPYQGQPAMPPSYSHFPHRYPPLPPPHPHSMTSPSQDFSRPMQAWGNPSFQHHQSWDHPDRNIQYSSEEEWAAKARAWAATDSMPESHYTRPQFTPLGRMGEPELAYHDHAPKIVPSAIDNQQSQRLQSNGRSFYAEDETMHRETDHLASPPRSYHSNSSMYEQEVPYTYSSSQGNREPFDYRERLQESVHPQFIVPAQLSSVEAPHFIPANHHPKTDQPQDFHSKSAFLPDQHNLFSYNHIGPARNEGAATNQNIVPSSVHAGSFPPIPLPPSGTHFDSLFASQSSISVHTLPVFGVISAPSFQVPISPASVPFGLGVGTSLHAPEFPGDGNGAFNLSERPKKAAVPNWLREEIIKKKSAIASSSLFHSGMVEIEDANMQFRKTDQADNSLDSRKSEDDDDDDEEEVEEARSAAINQEIKRILTEVLLKVTDELFDEIATKIIYEDEPSANAAESTNPGNSKLSPPLSISTSKASSKTPVPLRADSKTGNDAGASSSPSFTGGDLLGLANYVSDASDGDDDHQESQKPFSRKIDGASHHLGAMKDSGTQKKSPNSDSNGYGQMEMPSISDCGERKGIEQFHAKIRASETFDNSSFTNTERIGEFLQDDVKYPKSSGAVCTEGTKRLESVNGDKNSYDNCRDGEGNILSSANKKSEKTLNSKGFIREAVSGSHQKDNDNSEHKDKRSEKMGKMDDKLPERFSEKYAKHGVIERETHLKSISRIDSIKDSRKDALKNRVDLKKDYERRSEPKRDRKGDYKRDGKEDCSDFAREKMNRNLRSKSPVSMGKHAKDNSSEESSDKSRKRKLQAHRNNMATSPKSTKRQASRSPHSKHSHSRHSPYSSSKRNRRSRSISPVRRMRLSKHK